MPPYRILYISSLSLSSMLYKIEMTNTRMNILLTKGISMQDDFSKTNVIHAVFEIPAKICFDFTFL